MRETGRIAQRRAEGRTRLFLEGISMFDALIDAAFRHKAQQTVRLEPSEGIANVPSSPVFLYVHVPFCEVLCPYCSFHRVHFEERRARRYFAALRREIRRYHERGLRLQRRLRGRRNADGAARRTGGHPGADSRTQSRSLRGLGRDQSEGPSRRGPEDARERWRRSPVGRRADLRRRPVATDGAAGEVRLPRRDPRPPGRSGRTLQDPQRRHDLEPAAADRGDAGSRSRHVAAVSGEPGFDVSADDLAERRRSRMAKTLGKRHKERMGDYYDRILARLGSVVRADVGLVLHPRQQEHRRIHRGRGQLRGAGQRRVLVCGRRAVRDDLFAAGVRGADRPRPDRRHRRASDGRARKDALRPPRAAVRPAHGKGLGSGALWGALRADASPRAARAQGHRRDCRRRTAAGR